MATLRRWQLTNTDPLLLELAADARLSATDPADDQGWRLSLGQHDSPALALQTRYGGRVGLASLVPMWALDDAIIYQSQAYARPPVVTAFAPGFLQVQARITPRLALRAEFWVMESHAVGCRCTLANLGDQPAALRLDLFGHVASEGKEQPLALLDLPAGGTALSLGHLANLQPIAVLEGATAIPDVPTRSRIGVDLTVPSNGKIAVRWVHAGLPTARQSLALAAHWLAQDWNAAFERIAHAAQAIPVIETGDTALDATIAFSFQQLLQSYLRPAGDLPHASLVACRAHDRGFNPRRERNHTLVLNAQDPTLAYLASLATAAIDPALAQGIVQNYLAVQEQDGTIDWRPDPTGRHAGLLCPPVLARLAWGLFHYTEDAAFLRDTVPGLRRFLDRWLANDADNDGLPEWQAEAQTGYPYFPTFAVSQPWGQHADIRYVESPDLAAYLLSEAASLHEIAYYLRDASAAGVAQQHTERLQSALESLWRDGRYAYRDRDTHETASASIVLDNANAAEQHFPALPLAPPARLVIHVAGGWEHAPRMTLHLEGLGTDGQAISETAASDEFIWTTTRGAYTSRAVFSQVDRVWFDGLTRVYRLSVTTLDTTRVDINALLPLWAVALPQERKEQLIRLLADETHFWRPSGVTMCSAQDPQFDPANETGSGGIWPFWLTLIGEGLIEANQHDLAAALLKRLLKTQTAVLAAQKSFTRFYHSDEPIGLGERGHLGGIVPLHLLLRVLGVRVIHPGKVWTGGPFAWATPVTLRQRGVTVIRNADITSVRFPSGHIVDLPAGAPWQEVTDPAYSPPPAPPAHTAPRSDDPFFDIGEQPSA